MRLARLSPGGGQGCDTVISPDVEFPSSGSVHQHTGVDLGHCGGRWANCRDQKSSLYSSSHR